jgi:hypothetical protein
LPVSPRDSGWTCQPARGQTDNRLDAGPSVDLDRKLLKG